MSLDGSRRIGFDHPRGQSSDELPLVQAWRLGDIGSRCISRVPVSCLGTNYSERLGRRLFSPNMVKSRSIEIPSPDVQTRAGEPRCGACNLESTGLSSRDCVTPVPPFAVGLSDGGSIEIFVSPGRRQGSVPCTAATGVAID